MTFFLLPLFFPLSLSLFFTALHLIYAGNVKSSENPPPFNNEAYSAFKRGNVVKGILCPSLTNSFRARSLERSYLTYSHRQRQKSLLIVNIVDLVLKIVLAVVWLCKKSNDIVSTSLLFHKTISLAENFSMQYFNFTFFTCMKHLVYPTRSGYMVDMLRVCEYEHLCFRCMEMLCE